MNVLDVGQSNDVTEPQLASLLAQLDLPVLVGDGRELFEDLGLPSEVCSPDTVIELPLDSLLELFFGVSGIFVIWFSSLESTTGGSLIVERLLGKLRQH